MQIKIDFYKHDRNVIYCLKVISKKALSLESMKRKYVITDTFIIHILKLNIIANLLGGD